MSKEKCYCICNLILLIKSYFLIVVSTIAIFLGIIFIARGKIIVDQSQGSLGNENCSASLGGGIMQVVGIIILFISLCVLVLGLIYMVLSRKMKKNQGVKNIYTILLFVLEILSSCCLIVVMCLSSLKWYYLILLMIVLIESVVTSVGLGTILNYQENRI